MEEHNDFDEEQAWQRADDGATCRSCRTGGLYWADHWSADGICRRRLFNDRNRLHVCNIADDFAAIV